MEPLRARIREFVPLRGDERAIDVGAGTGPLARALAPLVAKVVALDLVPEMLEAGKSRGPESRIEFVEGDALALPFPDATFDLVATLRTLHHLDRPARAVLELARVAKPGGLVLVIDQLAPDDSDVRDALEWIERLRDPSHAGTLTEDELRCLLAAAALSVERFELEHEERDLSEFLDLADTGEAERQQIVDFAAELVAGGRGARMGISPTDGGHAFTQRVGWFLARRSSAAT